MALSLASTWRLTDSRVQARLAKALELNKEFESRDKTELTQEWLEKKLQFFKA